MPADGAVDMSRTGCQLRLLFQIIPMSLTILLAGCSFQDYRPEPLDVEQSYRQLRERNLNSLALRDFFIAQGYSPSDWPLTQWDVDAFVLAALYLNPDIPVALAEWRLRQAGEITAGQRANPSLNLPLEWHTDTSDGQSPWLIGIVLDLILERSGKRAARIERAEWQTAAARIAIEQVAWQVRSRVCMALTALSTSRSQAAALEQRITVVDNILKVLQRRQELGQLATFELSRQQLERQRLRLQHSQQLLRIEAARQQLAAAIGIAPAQLETVVIDWPQVSTLPHAEALPSVGVQGLALRSRYDIRVALMDYAAQEAALRLQIEKQYPDITLSPGLVFDQSDNIWQLGAAWILPLFHNHEGEIAEAMARRHLKQMQFIDLQSTIMANVSQARSDYLGRLATYSEAELLQAEAQQYLQQVQRQLQAGYTDRLQYLRASQVVAEADQAVVDSRAATLRAYTRLEQVLQHRLDGSNHIPAVISTLIRETSAHPGNGQE